MHQIHPNEALDDFLAAIVASNLTMHLFSNDVTPGPTTVLADLTEVSVSGYGSLTLFHADWGSPSTLSGQRIITQSARTYTASSGSATAYGYYIVNAAGTHLVSASRFDDPLPLSSSQSITVTPKLAMGSKFTS